MSSVWEREMEQLLANHQRRLNMYGVRLKSRRSRVEEAVSQLLGVEDELLKALRAYEEAARKLLSRRDDLEVLVRNYNKSTLDTYHADASCGWAPGSGRYERILLSTARELGYGACGSCGYRVRQAERKKAALNPRDK